MSNHIASAEIAEEAFGKAPSEIARIAKDHGVVPDETGLIEFEEPVGFYHDEKSGEETPVMGVIDLESAQPSDEEQGEAEEVAADVSPAATAGYHWLLTYGGTRSFSASQTSSAVAIQGVQITDATIAARTRYNTTFPSPGVSVTFYTSPWRAIRGTYYFTSTVYGRSVEIRPKNP